MKNYLQMWSEERLELGSLPLKTKVTVTGERNQHLGPRWEFARIQVTVEPAPQFEVVDSTGDSDELRQAGYLDWAVFGLLDVLMVAESAPIRNVRITLEKAESNPIDSSRMAFRHAGRDAARKVLDSVGKHRSADKSDKKQ